MRTVGLFGALDMAAGAGAAAGAAAAAAGNDVDDIDVQTASRCSSLPCAAIDMSPMCDAAAAVAAAS